MRSRLKYLQNFFDELLRHKAIMCYELTERFLRVISAKEIEAFLAAEDQKKGPCSVREMTHSDGTVFYY